MAALAPLSSGRPVREVRETDLPLQPSEYFLRQCVLSMEADEELAADVMERFGNDLMVISTDYPHPDSAFPHAMNEFFELDLPDETRRKVLWDNCARLYALEG